LSVSHQVLHFEKVKSIKCSIQFLQALSCSSVKDTFQNDQQHNREKQAAFIT